MAVGVLPQYTSLAANHLIIAGIPITGFADDAEAIVFQTTTLTAVKTSPDGLVIYGGTGQKGGDVVIKLQANSPSINALSTLMQEFKADLGRVFGGTYLYPDGSSINMSDGALISAPPAASQGNGVPGDLEYTFHFGRIF